MPHILFARLVYLQAQVAAAATPEAPKQLDPWQLMMDASVTVKLVMIALILMGLAGVFVLGSKFFRLQRSAAASTSFLKAFWADEQRGWSTERLEQLYSSLNAYEASPLAAVFRAGYVELARVMSAPEGYSEGDIQNIERSLQRSATVELTAMEAMLSFLATTGSTAPFIGLFGTVWGIMSSFLSIGAQARASLDVVAPGIAEALIATAIGLVVAIPSVMGYNYLLRRIRVLEGEIDAFSKDYLNIVRRHFLRG